MMKHRHIPMRLASMLLVLALFAGLIAPANATGANSSGAELRVTTKRFPPMCYQSS